MNADASPRYDLAAFPRFDVAASPRFDVAAFPRFDVAAFPRYDVAASPRFDVAASPRFDVAASPRFDVAAFRGAFYHQPNGWIRLDVNISELVKLLRKCVEFCLCGNCDLFHAAILSSFGQIHSLSDFREAEQISISTSPAQ